jgi:hypothetical protein
MLGLGAGVIKYCRADIDTNNPTGPGIYVAADAEDRGRERQCVPGQWGHQAGTTHDDIKLLEPLFHIDANGVPNYYEATCFFNSKYYAVGVGVFNTPRAVVEACFSPSQIGWHFWTGQTSISPCNLFPWTPPSP